MLLREKCLNGVKNVLLLEIYTSLLCFALEEIKFSRLMV